MGVYATGIALVALTIAVIALIRTRRQPGPVRSPARLRGTADADPASRRTAVVRLVRFSGRRSGARATDWLGRVVPGACASVGVTMIIAAFAWQNSQAVGVRFLDWHVDGLPLAVVMLASGVVTGGAVTALTRIERRALVARIRRLEHAQRQHQSTESRPGPHRYIALRRRMSAGGSTPYRHS